MANPVVQTSAVGVTVAVDTAGTAAFQVVKLDVGASGTSTPVLGTTGVPGATETGIIVAVKPGVSVSAQVSGTVSVAAMPAVSGTVSVQGTVSVATAATVLTLVTLLGTVNVSLAGVDVTTTGIPAAASTGIIVAIKPGATVNVPAGLSVSAQVSGTVTVQISSTVLSVNTAPTVAGASVTAQVSGTVSVSNLPGSTTGSSGMSGVLVWLGASQTVLIGGQSVTIQQGASVSAVVSGTVTVNVSGVTPVTTQASVSVAGVPVWWHPTAAMNVTIVAGAGGGGSVTTTAPGITATGQVVWIAGGQSTTVSPIFVSQINAPAAGGGSVTTTAPGITATGQVMWLAGGQSTTVSPVYVSQINPPAGGGGSVTTAVPSVSATGQIMWIVGGQSTTANPVVVTGTVTAGAGTTVVSLTGSALVSGTVTVLVSGIAPVATQASVSVTGLPVWWNNTASVVVANVVSVSLGGLANVVVTTTATSGVSGPIVWLGAGQTLATVGTIVTQLGTQIVSVVPGLSVSAVVSGTVTANTVVTVLSTVLVNIVGGMTASTQVGNNPGLGVWLAPTQTMALVSTIVTRLGTAHVTGTVAAADIGRTQVLIIMTSTVIGVSGTTMAFTVYQGATQNTAGVTSWVVPAGKTFRVLAGAILAANSITTTPVLHRCFLIQSAALPTWTSAVPVALAVGVNCTSQGVLNSACAIQMADIAAGVTLGLAHTITSSTGSIAQVVINGYLFP